MLTQRPDRHISPFHGPNRLWSLWDMLRFKGRPLVDAIYKLAIVETLLSSAKDNVQIAWEPDDPVGVEGVNLINDMRNAVVELDARFTLKIIDRTLGLMKDGSYKTSQLLQAIPVIEGRLRDELDETHLFAVSSENAKYLDDTKSRGSFRLPPMTLRKPGNA